MLTRKAIVDHAITFKNPNESQYGSTAQTSASDILPTISPFPTATILLKRMGFSVSERKTALWRIPTAGTLTGWDQVDAYKLPNHDFDRRL